MTKPLAIFGAGGFAREVLQIVLDINDSHLAWAVSGFLVDEDYPTADAVHGLPVLGNLGWLARHPETSVVIAVGSSAARYRIAQMMQASGHCKFARLIHPRAWLGRDVEIGEGTVVCAGALVTTDISIGRHVHINLGATVGHDAVLHDFVTLNPGVSVSGNVTVSEGTELGTGSVVIPRVHVGEWSVVGAGSVVTKAQPSNSTIVGAPARAVKAREPGWHVGLLR